MEMIPSSRIQSYARAIPSSTSSSSSLISSLNRAAAVPLAPKKFLPAKVSCHPKFRLNALIGLDDGRPSSSCYPLCTTLISLHFDLLSASLLRGFLFTGVLG